MVIPSQSRYTAPNVVSTVSARGVLRVNSTLVMKSVVAARPLPL